MRSMILASSEKNKCGYPQRTFGHSKVIIISNHTFHYKLKHNIKCKKLSNPSTNAAERPIGTMLPLGNIINTKHRQRTNVTEAEPMGRPQSSTTIIKNPT
jgi:hypothetical protein